MDLKVFTISFFVMVTFMVPFSRAYTAEQDVYAINAFYDSLGSPLLPGWVTTGGDPCLEAWQGVQCLSSNITGIVLNGANLGGQLGDALGNFTSIAVLDLSNNNIGGSIPENLPITLQNLFLSDNQFTGNIPGSLSKLTLLTAMSVNDNHLTGDLPDAFQTLASLVNLDLSSNNLSGTLPPSMGGLSSLTTLHVQNNQFSGTLDVLENLPIKDLNIEDNLFAGPIPDKMLSIPNFKKDGNPFNTTTPSSSPLPAPPRGTTPPSQTTPSTPSRVPPSDTAHPDSSDAPSSQPSSSATRKNNMSTMKIVGYVLLAVVLCVIIVLIVIYCLSKYQERELRDEGFFKSQITRISRSFKEPKIKEPSVKPNHRVKRVAEYSEASKSGQALDIARTDREDSSKLERDHVIDLQDTKVTVKPLPLPPLLSPPSPPPRLPPRLPPPPPPAVEKVAVNPIVTSSNVSTPPDKMNPPPRNPPPTSGLSFSVASLQQYTSSFSEENLIREGRLGKIYIGELPDGKRLEVMKIDNVNSRIPIEDFLELVLVASELKHPHVLELVGYCAEHGQRLLVHNHFSRRTLDDILYSGDDLNTRLSWDARLRIALGAAKALEYLHEGCQPSIVHKYFEPSNILVDEGYAACVSECGLSPLISSKSAAQLSGRIRAMYSYEAPEINENGSYTEKSDVYSFGIVMLELLTGRRPFDSSRPRQEQHLVRWASSKLYDINALQRMVDPSIIGNCSEKSLSCFADIISRCIQQGPEFRPSMSEIVQDLIRMVKDVGEAGSRAVI